MFSLSRLDHSRPQSVLFSINSAAAPLTKVTFIQLHTLMCLLHLFCGFVVMFFVFKQSQIIRFQITKLQICKQQHYQFCKYCICSFSNFATYLQVIWMMYFCVFFCGQVSSPKKLFPCVFLGLVHPEVLLFPISLWYSAAHKIYTFYITSKYVTF